MKYGFLTGICGRRKYNLNGVQRCCSKTLKVFLKCASERCLKSEGIEKLQLGTKKHSNKVTEGSSLSFVETNNYAYVM